VQHRCKEYVLDAIKVLPKELPYIFALGDIALEDFLYLCVLEIEVKYPFEVLLVLDLKSLKDGLGDVKLELLPYACYLTEIKV